MVLIRSAWSRLRGHRKRRPCFAGSSWRRGASLNFKKEIADENERKGDSRRRDFLRTLSVAQRLRWLSARDRSES